jgi:hypothetical protein
VNAAGKLTAFAVVLGGALGGGAALGAVAGPIDVDSTVEHDDHDAHATTSQGGDEQAAPHSRPAPLPEATTATVDGYQVDLAGSPLAGTSSELTLTVREDGEPVTDLDPYLGAAGHLVAIRASDLAYLHVHPLDDADDANGPRVRFATEVPSAGDYRLFFDFSHRGEVRTAAFTVHVAASDEPAAATATTTTSSATAAHAGHGGL